MVTQKPNSGAPKKGAIKYSDKFGLDKERKKLGTVTDEKANPPTLSPGENFRIVKIVMTTSKKRYDMQNMETGELGHAKIPIAQFDVETENGQHLKLYSPNSAIVEACQNILKDPDFAASEDGTLAVPAEIGGVIEGKGEKGRGYLAFV